MSLFMIVRIALKAKAKGKGQKAKGKRQKAKTEPQTETVLYESSSLSFLTEAVSIATNSSLSAWSGVSSAVMN